MQEGIPDGVPYMQFIVDTLSSKSEDGKFVNGVWEQGFERKI